MKFFLIFILSFHSCLFAHDAIDLYIFRHGETNSNVARVLSGDGDTEAYLTETGIVQALALGQKIQQQAIHLDALFSSDLKRAATTAQYVVSQLAFKPQIIFAPQLREVLHGPYELTSTKERGLKFAKIFEEEIAKLQHVDISKELAAGTLDPFKFYKIHPISGKFSDENISIKRINTYFTDQDPQPETGYEFYLRIDEEIKSIISQSLAKGYRTVGISTHGAVITTLIDTEKYKGVNVFVPPYYGSSEIEGYEHLMPKPTKVTNCALAHFKYNCQSQTLKFCGFIL